MAWGKIIGGALGGLLSGPIGAGIGVALGAGVDQTKEDHLDARGNVARDDAESLRLEQQGNVLRVTTTVLLPPEADSAVVRVEQQGNMVKTLMPPFADDDGDFALARSVTGQRLSFDLPLLVLSLGHNERHTLLIGVGFFQDEEPLGVLTASSSVTITPEPWRFIDWMAPAVDVLCHYALRSGNWTAPKIQRIKALFSVVSPLKEEAEALKGRLKRSSRPPLAASIESYHRRFDEPEFSMQLLACSADLLDLSGETSDRIAAEMTWLGAQLGLDEQEVSEALGFEQGSSGSSQSPSGDVQWACGILAVPAGSDASAIQQAWRKKISELHPDKYTSLPEVVQNLIKEKAQELNRARDILLN